MPGTKTHTIRLVIAEGERIEVALSPEQYLTLKTHYAGRLDFTPSGSSGIYTLAARDYVGRLTLSPDTLLEIQPKVAVANLFYMLCADAGLAEFYPPPIGLSANPDIFHFVITAFIAAVERIAAQGLNYGYFPVEADLPLVRGRIDLGAQVSRFGELRHRHACAFAELSMDTPENKIVLAALRYVPFLLDTHEAETTRRARYISRRFEGVSAISRGTALNLLASTRSHRLNARYGPALVLARLVLNHLTLDNKSGPHPFASFLINMPRLFESFVTKRLSTLLLPHGLRVVAQRHDYLDEQKQVGIRPDMLVYDRQGTRPLLVIDTKYRLVDEGDLNSDLYQVSAYLDRYGLERGVLVYPQFRRTDRSNLKLLNTLKDIHLLSLDLDAPTPTKLDAACESLAEQVAVLARSRDISVPNPSQK